MDLHNNAISLTACNIEEYAITVNSQMVSVGANFSSTCHTKQFIPWPTLSASCVVIYSQLSACPGEMESFKDNPATLSKRPHKSHSKGSLGNLQHQYLTEFLTG